MGARQEQDKNAQVALMTQATHARLLAEKAAAEAKATELQRSVGDTFDNAADWHDNFAFDQIQQDLNLIGQRINHLISRLNNVQFIEPRKDTDTVGIGNTVIVHYAGEPTPERFTILGIDDQATRPDWISFASPLGSNLLGRRPGETVEIQRGIRVTLKQVLPGQF